MGSVFALYNVQSPNIVATLYFIQYFSLQFSSSIRQSRDKQRDQDTKSIDQVKGLAISVDKISGIIKLTNSQEIAHNTYRHGQISISNSLRCHYTSSDTAVQV